MKIDPKPLCFQVAVLYLHTRETSSSAYVRSILVAKLARKDTLFVYQIEEISIKRFPIPSLE